MNSYPHILVLIFAVCFSSTARAQDDLAYTPTPEKVAYLQTKHFEKPLHVWLPKNYDATRKHPVMFYYHGTTGQPTIEFLRLYTGGEDWILVGMTYLKPGRFEHSEENLVKERKILDEVLNTVSKGVSVDPTRVFVSGFSKGGWVTGLFLQNDTKLAGGMILGAGTFTEGITKHPKKLFIGVGEIDPNLAMSIRARRQFSANIATEITFDIWPGIGHQFPLNKVEPSSDSMKQWLRVQAGVATQSDAVDWMETTLLETEKSTDLSAFQKLEYIQKMQESPYAALLDREGTDALADAISNLKSQAAVASESLAKVQYFKVLKLESRDRFVSTLAEAAAQYSKITAAFPATAYGIKAGAAVERIQQTLSNVPK